jgi:hypothetical protein
MLRVKDLDVMLFYRVQGRMDYRVLMPCLIQVARKRYGLTRAEIRAAFKENKLAVTTPGHLRGTHPREAGILRRRIQVLLDLMGARIWRDELPEKMLVQMCRKTRRATRTYKSSTKQDLLDTLHKIRTWQARDGIVCSQTQALILLFLHVLGEWLKKDPKLRVDPVFIREDYRCQVPGCSARANLHDHHARWRSRGGTNDLWNRVAVCAWHHAQLHEGKMTLTGRADGVLYWKIGVDRPRYYKGDVRLKTSWEPEPDLDPSGVTADLWAALGA